MEDKRIAYKQAIMEVAPALRNDVDNYVFALETRVAQLEAAQQSVQSDWASVTVDKNGVVTCKTCGTGLGVE